MSMNFVPQINSHGPGGPLTGGCHGFSRQILRWRLNTDLRCFFRFWGEITGSIATICGEIRCQNVYIRFSQMQLFAEKACKIC